VSCAITIDLHKGIPREPIWQSGNLLLNLQSNDLIRIEIDNPKQLYIDDWEYVEEGTLNITNRPLLESNKTETAIKVMVYIGAYRFPGQVPPTDKSIPEAIHYQDHLFLSQDDVTALNNSKDKILTLRIIE